MPVLILMVIGTSDTYDDKIAKIKYTQSGIPKGGAKGAQVTSLNILMVEIEEYLSKLNTNGRNGF